MPDISELIIEIKYAERAVNELEKVNTKLKQTSKSADELKTLGKTLFAGWSFTKLISMTKSFGDAWKDVLVTTRKFDTVFGSFNKNAADGVKVLTTTFHETNRSAKDLMATIGSRLDFGFDTSTLGKVSADLAKISEELASFYGKNVTDVSLKLTQALAGQTKGLKEYGINIDINSEKFKDLAKNIKSATNETDSGARALAIYTTILGKVKSQEGTFETQAKSLSQLLEDIKKSFIDGPLAQAGNVLSKLLSPLLTTVNYILASPVISKIVGITLAIVTLTGALSSLKLVWGAIKFIVPKISITIDGFVDAVMKIPEGIGKASLWLLKEYYIFESKIAFVLSSFFFKFNRSISLYLGRIALENQKAWLKGANAVIPIIAPFSAILGTAIAAIFLGTADFILSKISPSYKKVSDKISNYISDIIESFVNFGKTGKWQTNEERFQSQFKEWEEKINFRKQIIEKYDEKVNEALASIDQINKQIEFPDDLITATKDFYEEFSELNDQIPTIKLAKKAAEEAFKTAKENLEKNKEEIKYKKDLYKKSHGMYGTLFTGEELDYQRASDLLLKMQKDLLKTADKATKMYNEYMRLYPKMVQMLNSKFTNFTWYKDLFDKIQSSLKELTPTEKLKAIQAKIDKFKELYGDAVLNPEDAKAKYKELGELEMQKFEVEMEALNKEREFIEATNQMIKDYVDKAMEWKAQGVEAIDAYSAEGYKYMTSGYGSIAELGQLVKDQRNEEKSLQEKANSIAEGTKSVLEGIKKKVDGLPINGLIQFEIVN